MPWVRAVNASNVFGVVEGVHNVGVSCSASGGVVAHCAFVVSRPLRLCDFAYGFN